MNEALQYHSIKDEKISIHRPPYRSNSIFPPNGFTSSHEAYIREAKILKTCLIRNSLKMGRKYPWTVTLNIGEYQSPLDIVQSWKKACRRLKRTGVVCFWVREPSRNNRVHYHIIGKTDLSLRDVGQAFEYAMPHRSELKWRKKVEPIRFHWHMMHYVVKAKVSGKLKGKWLEDKYRSKRRLFKAGLGITKYGTVGDFWHGSYTKQKLWKEVAAISEKAREGILNNFGTSHLVDHVYDLFGGHESFDTIQRSLGYFADTPQTQSWVDTLLKDW